MTLSEALELPFNEYLCWCHDYCRDKAQQDLIFADVYANSALHMLEALWAKRYWYNKIIGTY